MQTSDLHVTKKQFKGLNITTIMTKKQYNNIKKSTNEADGMNYKLVQEYFEQHKKELITNPSRRHQINVLTVQGWRSGSSFENYDFDFYDPDLFYNDDDPLLVVYGIQIIEGVKIFTK